MALEMKQSLKLSQSLVMTPQLQQAIKLLQMTRMELQEVVTQELTENPVLEEVSDSGDADGPDVAETHEESLAAGADPEMEQRRDEEAFSEPQAKEDQLVAGKDDFNWDAYVEEFNSYSSSPTSASMKEINEDLPSFENALTKTASLEEHLTWQLSMASLTDEERKLGELIIGNLTPDGYFNASLEDISTECGMHLEDSEEVLKIIQKFDPIGVASRDLRECLLLQAQFMNPRQPMMEKIIDCHLHDLEKKNYNAISRALSIPMEEVISATRLIMELEPKPGRSFESNDTQYITPDIYVYKMGEEFVIVLNEDGMPKLRISPYYRNILQAASKMNSTPEGKGNADNKMTKEYVQDKLRSAVWLIRSIHNRQKTIYKVTDAIVKRQRDFFEKGSHFLKPMILRDVAADIGMHESTISRVTTNKYVHTPVGIFELKYFFNSSINSADGSDSLASESVKEKIKSLVTKEDPKNPLSDQKIVELLKSENIDIARRTVAKYRDMLGILSSGKRKKVF